MAKKQEVKAVEFDKEVEIATLRNRVAELEARESAEIVQDGNLTKEMQQLRKVKDNGLNEIKYEENFPKTLFLWHVSGHNVGKRVGPIHTTNAEQTFMNFSDAGIRLSLNRPSEAWIEKYKETQEYKTAAEIERKRRAGKNRSTKANETERLIAIIAKQQGVDPKTLVDIKEPQEVGR